MPEEPLDPNKYHVMTPKIKKILILSTLVFMVTVVPAASYFYYNFAINRQTQAGRGTTFVINNGDSVGIIAENLYRENLVNSAFLFKLYVTLNNFQDKLQAGVYNIEPGASVVDLGSQFQHGTNDLAVTFLEGWRAEEFALTATKTLENVDYEKFLALAAKNAGKLFPDTYYLSSGVDETELVDILVATYASKTANLLTPQVLEELQMTEDEVLNFAAMVEREVRNETDRPIVAGILINRWRREELIGADATTQYAMVNEILCANTSDTAIDCVTTDEFADGVDWWPQNITLDALNIDSSYNTRKNVGLPPAPIANPGLSAIEAVVNYSDTTFDYYLTDIEGVTHYARTLEEHNANIARFL